MREAILFVGASGAGKSTQAKLLQPHGYEYISSGDLIRAYKPDPSTELGKEVLEAKAHGAWLSDHNILGIIDEHIGAAAYGSGTRFILDGFPRTVGQIQPAAQRFEFGSVLYLQSHDDELLEQRLAEGNRGRADDASAADRWKRINDFYTLTQPVLWHYGSLVHAIDATGTYSRRRTVEEVHADVLHTLGLH